MPLTDAHEPALLRFQPLCVLAVLYSPAHLKTVCCRLPCALLPFLYLLLRFFVLSQGGF
ncbi:hypothetical protein [Deinococcus ruber]|uniref:hypothetical protein n=1 Tax=Deinococcus ruber TaxID=1848197 RepID=UPI00166C5903|nr:hypothetical protein [Deinococcus ruber]